MQKRNWNRNEKNAIPNGKTQCKNATETAMQKTQFETVKHNAKKFSVKTAMQNARQKRYVQV